MTETDSPAQPDLADQFPILENGLYFNHAAVGPWPRCAAEAVQQFAEENLRQGSAGYRDWYARENELRHGLKTLLGASSAADIALLKNTSEGISIVAFGLDWQPGDNMVLPADEFPSNRLPWLAQAHKGVDVREIDIRAAANAEQALLDAMDADTRLLSVSAVQWQDGFRLDLEVLGEACRRRGILFFVDAIQQLGALPMDVQRCHIDFLAADAHKWLLAPEGIAVFFCSESARPHLQLLQQGWHMFESPFDFERSQWVPASSAKRFEAGSPNTIGQAALHASVQLLLRFGMEEVGHRVLANTRFLMKQLADIPGARIASRQSALRQSGIVSFAIDSIPLEALHRQLTEAGASTVIRGQALRVSPHFYQGETQLGQFLEIVVRALP
jgi:selenocysteine lyase/cysteine desulfurase